MSLKVWKADDAFEDSALTVRSMAFSGPPRARTVFSLKDHVVSK